MQKILKFFCMCSLSSYPISSKPSPLQELITESLFERMVEVLVYKILVSESDTEALWIREVAFPTWVSIALNKSKDNELNKVPFYI